MATRIAAVDHRLTRDGTQRHEPMGIFLERSDGLGLQMRYLDEVRNGNIGVGGWKRYVTRALDMDRFRPFWRAAGALLDFARTEEMEGRFLDIPLYTPREWLTFQSFGMDREIGLGFFEADASDTLDVLYERFVVDAEPLDVDVGFRDEMPSYMVLGWRPGYDPMAIGDDRIKFMTGQGMATLEMLKDGVCGFRFAGRNKFFDDLRTLRVLEPPTDSIAQAWERQDSIYRQEWFDIVGSVPDYLKPNGRPANSE